MGTEGTPIQGTLRPYERTVQATIITPFGGRYVLNVARETWYIDEYENKVGTSPVAGRGYTFDFANIKDVTITAGDVTVTVAQLAVLIQTGIDQLVEAQKALEVKE